jgi:hypothetical protein
LQQGGLSDGGPALGTPGWQADRERELRTLRAEEEEALATALSRQTAAQDAAARETQLLMQESAELRE